jgi:hypothetical protein
MDTQAYSLLDAPAFTYATPFVMATLPEVKSLHTNETSTLPFGPGPISHIEISSASADKIINGEPTKPENPDIPPGLTGLVNLPAIAFSDFGSPPPTILTIARAANP